MSVAGVERDSGPALNGHQRRERADILALASEGHVIEARNVSQRFRDKAALDDVSLAVAPGEIHALLGPNGAGKTTLLRIVAGLLVPTQGEVTAGGFKSGESPRELRSMIGLVPAGDRSFYLRISGLENLVFFGRLHGMRRRQATVRAREALAEVGLSEAATKRVGFYSHGMQKRLSVARALLNDAVVLLVDEATQGLDPEGARRVRELVGQAAGRGAAVIWATQHLDEIRGFANRVTVLDHGRVRFVGSVPELMSHAAPRRHLLRLRNCRPPGTPLEPAAKHALNGRGRIAASGEGNSEHYLLTLADGVTLGDALSALVASGIEVLACRQEQSEIEEAFLSLTGEPPS
jgi:ABC-type multidrug transport system ATPase subunit